MSFAASPTTAFLATALAAPDEATLARAPEALRRHCAQARQVGDLYAWGERRRLRARMIRALLRHLLAQGALAGDDLATLPDWSWVWDPTTASGPGTPRHYDPADDPRTDAETPEPAAEEDSEEDEDEAPAPEEEEEPLSLAERERLRSARPEGARATTINVNRLSKRERQHLADTTPPHPGGRPRTRGECVDAPRPCPWVTCRHHLYLDVDEDTGAIKILRPDVEVEDMVESCSLDIADRGPTTLHGVGDALNITRERIRQVEMNALRHLQTPRRVRVLTELHTGDAPRRFHLPVLPPAEEAPRPVPPPRPRAAPPPPPVVEAPPVIVVEAPPPSPPEPVEEAPAPAPVVAVEEAPTPTPDPEAHAWLAQGERHLADLQVLAESQIRAVEAAQERLEDTLSTLDQLRDVLAQARKNLAAGRPYTAPTLPTVSPTPTTPTLRERILASLRAAPGTPEELSRRLAADRKQIHSRLQELGRAGRVEQLPSGRYTLASEESAPQPQGWAPGTPVRATPRRDAILALLEEEPRTALALARCLAVTRQRVTAALAHLRTTGWVTQGEDGLWRLRTQAAAE